MSVFALAMAAGQGCGAESAGKAAPPAAGAADKSRWMQENLDVWGKRPLRQWVLPSSHDAAMYESGWVKSLGQTQDLSIYEQLIYGVRYFDLRPRLSGGKLFMHHGPIVGPELAVALDDVGRFCRGRRELVILKYSHYAAFGDSAYQQMVREIKQRLDPWLLKSLPKGKRLAEIPLKDLLGEKCAVVVACDGDYPLAKRTPGIWVYRDWDAADPQQGDLRVYDRYSDTTDFDRMKADQLDKFARFDGTCRQPDLPCDLFLLSWTLTPATNVRGYCETPNRKLADEMKDLRVPNRFGRAVNLLYVDYVESAHVTDVALAMNRRLERADDRKSK